MQRKLAQFVAHRRQDPAVESVVGFTGGGADQFRLHVRRAEAAGRAQDHRPTRSSPACGRKLAQVAGRHAVPAGGAGHPRRRPASNAQYQYTLQADDLDELYDWAPKIAAALQHDARADRRQYRPAAQGAGEPTSSSTATTAARLGLTASADRQHALRRVRPASGLDHLQSRQPVSRRDGGRAAILAEPGDAEERLRQHLRRPVSGTQATNAVAGTVVASAGNRLATSSRQSHDAARNLATNAIATTGHGGTSTGAAVSTAPETMVPLSAFAHFEPGTTPLAVNHQGQFVAATISFNLPPSVSLSDGVASDRGDDDADRRAGDDPRQLPGHGAGLPGSRSPTSRSLILAALLAVYIVLGMLYESYIHPITILSTLPSAGVGALLALMLFNTEFSIIALIGVILLIGIVKKNAIMMIDFALDAERSAGARARATRSTRPACCASGRS